MPVGTWVSSPWGNPQALAYCESFCPHVSCSHLWTELWRSSAHPQKARNGMGAVFHPAETLEGWVIGKGLLLKTELEFNSNSHVNKVCEP